MLFENFVKNHDMHIEPKISELVVQHGIECLTFVPHLHVWKSREGYLHLSVYLSPHACMELSLEDPDSFMINFLVSSINPGS